MILKDMNFDQFESLQDCKRNETIFEPTKFQQDNHYTRYKEE